MRKLLYGGSWVGVFCAELLRPILEATGEAIRLMIELVNWNPNLTEMMMPKPRFHIAKINCL
jgi:hypothetical protein